MARCAFYIVQLLLPLKTVTKGFNFIQDFGDEEKLLIECLSFTCQGRFPPLCAFLGGVSAQEVLKALSGKFEPLQQWVCLQCLFL